MIEWRNNEESWGIKLAHGGYVPYAREVEHDSNHKYFVGVYNGRLICDVYDLDKGKWYSLNVPVESVEDGKKICEMWEATGAY